jgi:hypothetical protein
LGHLGVGIEGGLLLEYLHALGMVPGGADMPEEDDDE